MFDCVLASEVRNKLCMVGYSVGDYFVVFAGKMATRAYLRQWELT